jgi:transposase
VRENLQKLGYQVAIPRPIPFISEAAKARRVFWAESHLRQKWEKVVFSDETSFQMFSNKTLMRFKGRRPGRGVVKYPFKVHVWGAFCAQGTIGFHMFSENLDGHLYREILSKNLFQQASQVLGKSWIFQQDNDPKHTAKLTKELLERKCPEVLDWPSHSPDLNPIENLWSIMKRKVEKKVNKLLGEKKKITTQLFMEIIKGECENLDSNMCLNLVNSMPRRLELVIQNAGRKIKY